VASIPSKFETILHEGGREKNAFWNRTHRFTYTDNEMPGPGQYFKPNNPERVAPSFSQKGYTGMISKSSRFVPMRRATAPPPGTYDPTGGFKAITDKRDYSVVNYTSMFAKPIVAPDYIKGRRHVEEMQPGPGAYNTAGNALASNRPGKRLAFNGSSARFGAEKRKKGDEDEELGPPAPGSYDPEKMNKLTGAMQKLYTNVPSAAFNSRTGRKYDELRKSKDEGISELKPHPSLGPSLGILVDIRSSSPTKAQPGPGTYEPFIADQLLTLDKIRHSSMFSRTNLDRFGKPLEKKAEAFVTPGPGTYNWQKRKVEKTQASMAAFVSTSDRTGLGEPLVKGQPGPAYYNPSLPAKRSFHLNANGRWV